MDSYSKCTTKFHHSHSFDAIPTTWIPPFSPIIGNPDIPFQLLPLSQKTLRFSIILTGLKLLFHRRWSSNSFGSNVVNTTLPVEHINIFVLEHILFTRSFLLLLVLIQIKLFVSIRLFIYIYTNHRILLRFIWFIQIICSIDNFGSAAVLKIVLLFDCRCR